MTWRTRTSRRCTRARRPRSGRPRCRASPTATCRSHPGPNNAREIDDGGAIGADDTAAPVDLDQLFNTLDAKTRAGPPAGHRGPGHLLRRHGRRSTSEALKYLSPALSTTSRLTQELVARQRDASNASWSTRRRRVGAIAERRGELEQLVGNANATAEAIGDENAALDRALGLLPDTLRKGNTTFVNLRAALDDLDVLVAESKPATKDLDVFFRAPAPAGERRRAHDPRPAPADPHARREQRPDRVHRASCRRSRSSPRRVFPRSITALRPVAAVRRTRCASTRPTWPAGSPSSAQGARQLRRQRPLRARPADLQPVQLQRRHQRADQAARPASASTPSRPTSSSAARAAPCSRRPTAPRPCPTVAGLRLRTSSPADETPARDTRARRRAAARGRSSAGRRRRRRGLRGAGDLRQRHRPRCPART